jgi:hypothetical protein
MLDIPFITFFLDKKEPHQSSSSALNLTSNHHHHDTASVASEDSWVPQGNFFSTIQQNNQLNLTHWMSLGMHSQNQADQSHNIPSGSMASHHQHHAAGQHAAAAGQLSRSSSTTTTTTNNPSKISSSFPIEIRDQDDISVHSVETQYYETPEQEQARKFKQRRVPQTLLTDEQKQMVTDEMSDANLGN